MDYKSKIEDMANDIGYTYEDLEKYVIQDIARRVTKTGRYTETAELMVQSMMQQGYSPAKIRSEVMKAIRADKALQKEIADETLAYKKEVRQKIKDMEKAALAKGDKYTAEAGDMAFKADLAIWSVNKAHVVRHAKIIEKYQKQIKERLAIKNGQLYIGRTRVEGVYTKTVQKAFMQMASGTTSYRQAVRNAVHEYAKQGMQVHYDSGAVRYIDTAVQNAVRTSYAQLAGETTIQNCADTDEDLVEVEAHEGARTDGSGGPADHQYWQGKVYSISGRDYTGTAVEERLGYTIESLEDATGYPNDPEGLCGYNCGHTFYVFFKDDSEPTDWGVKSEPVTIDGKEYTPYEVSQKRRSMERDIRGYKRESYAASAMGDDPSEYNDKAKAKTQEYKDFSEAAGVRAKIERTRIP